MPDEPEVLGLLALMLLIESRRAARTTADGELVLLADQDRAPLGPRPDRRGPGARPRAACGATSPGPYQIQAAINAVHSDAPTAADTDWRQIVAALRPAAGDRAEPGRGAQPRGRGGRGRRPGAGAGARRRRSTSTLPPVPRHPRRPAPPGRSRPEAALAYDAAIADGTRRRARVPAWAPERARTQLAGRVATLRRSSRPTSSARRPHPDPLQGIRAAFHW